jgi:hypothetical protein
LLRSFLTFKLSFSLIITTLNSPKPLNMAEFTKLYFFVLMFLSLAVHTLPTDPCELQLGNEENLLSPEYSPSPSPYMDEEVWAPAYGEDFLSPEYPPSPSPAPYIDEEAWAPAYGEDFLSPEYPPSPSPSPYMDEDAWAPAYGEDFLSPEYPPSPSPYMDEEAWAPAYGEDFLSPEYPPSPSPYMDEEAWAPAYGEDFLSPEYPPSPSPYMDEEALAPEFEDNVNSLSLAYASPPSPPPSEIESSDYYSPLEAPALSPSTALPALASGNESTSPVTPFNYSAEDDAAAVFVQESEGSSGWSQGNTTGFIIAVVCLVGLGGLLYKKRKDKKRSQEYKPYDLAKREEP